MYREPGKVDQYVVDDRPIIKRVFKLPAFPKLPVWVPGVAALILSPIACGFAWEHTHGGICVGLLTSLSILGCIGGIHAVVKADDKADK
jgi:hypothetical protein